MTLAGRLTRGATQLTASNAAVRLLAIVTMPVLTGLLDPRAYGVATLAGTVIALASVFALAGMDMTYSRAYHSAQPPNGAVVERFAWRFSLAAAAAVALVASLAWWLFAPVASGDELLVWLPVIIGLGIVLSVVNTLAQTRAQLDGRYRAMSIAISATSAISVAASIAVAWGWRQDATGLLLALLLSYLLPALALGVPSFASLRAGPSLSAPEGRALIRIGVAGVITAPLYWLLSSADRWFLQHYAGVDAVGIYSIGYSVAIVGMMVNNAVIAVWVPEAAREYERNSRQASATLGRVISRLIATMAVVWLAAAAAGGDLVRLLANERFHAARDYVPYIAGGVFFHGVLHLGNGVLLLAKRLNLAVFWWVAGAIACALLNMLLIPRFGATGAALTQTLSFALIGLGIFATALRLVRIDLDGWRLLALLPIVLGLGVAMIPPWHANALLSLALKLPVGIAMTLAAAWIMAPAWCAARAQHLRRVALP